MPKTFTLDTNCLIDVAEKRPAAPTVQALADAHAAGKADVAVVAITASEKQQDGHYIDDFTEFSNRLASLGLAFESYFAAGVLGRFILGSMPLGRRSNEQT